MADGQYITNADARSAISAIETVYEVAGTFSEDLLSEDITIVEGEVDTSVAARHGLPVTGAPALAMIKGIVIALIRSEAYGRLATVETPAIIMSNAKAARTKLASIASGKLPLGATAESTDEGTAGAFHSESEEPQMTRTKLKAF